MTKSGRYFHFKQFSVQHDRTTMKVGTDGVLLGAWANIQGAKTILDIGTGSGVIALMLAQRTTPDTAIDAVELEKENAAQAHDNVKNSLWPNRISVHQTDIKHFETETRYDVIVSNPPYFINSQQPPDEKRSQSRHTITLSYTTLLEQVARLLGTEGRFNVVLPYTEGLLFIKEAQERGFACCRKWTFKSRIEKPVERLLLEFSRFCSGIEENELVLYKSGEEWSDDYKRLTRDFYLKI